MIDLGVLSDIARAIIYPVGAFGFLNIAARMNKNRFVIYWIAAYFFYWSALLFVRLAISKEIYQVTVDLTATPLLGVIVGVVWWQVWRMRHD